LSKSQLRWIAAVVVSVSGITAGLVGCAAEAPRPITITGIQAKIGPFQRSAAEPLRHGKGRTARTGVSLSPSNNNVMGQTTLDVLLGPGDQPLANNGLCPPDMASIDDLFCVDRYEASLVELLPNGDERPFAHFNALDESQGATEHHVVRAISEPNVMPQAYISADQASQACARSGKRLCKANEWKKACKGPDSSTYGYGSTNEPGRCNDHGKAPMAAVFGLGGGSDPRDWGNRMNDQQLNQVPGTLAATGSHEGCTNGYGVYDMVGNLHEWVDDKDGTFLGGYYLDTHQNGDGCNYGTYAHASYYHDYSTGFRCCADVAP
jgi:formylglycine-generating enzyme